MAKLQVRRDNDAPQEPQGPKCAFHVDRIATGACEICAVFLCDDCKGEKDGQLVCADCKAGAVPGADIEGPTCKFHVNRPPSAACSQCKSFLCEECATLVDGVVICGNCQSAAPAPAEAAAPTAPPPPPAAEPAEPFGDPTPALAAPQEAAPDIAAPTEIDEEPAEEPAEEPQKAKLGVRRPQPDDAVDPKDEMKPPEPEQKKGLSTGAKIGIGLGGGCLVIVASVAFAFVSCTMKVKKAAEEIQKQVKNNPPKVTQPNNNPPTDNDDDDDDIGGPRDDDVFMFTSDPDRSFYLTLDGEKMKCKKKSAKIKLVSMGADKKAMIIGTRYKTSKDSLGSLEIQISPDALKEIKAGEKLILNDPDLTGDPLAIHVELTYEPKMAEAELRKKIGKKGVFVSDLGQKSQASYEGRLEKVYGNITFTSFSTQPGAEVAGVVQLQAMPKGGADQPIAKTYWRFKGTIPAEAPPTP